jgi:hypothetical protein
MRIVVRAPWLALCLVASVPAQTTWVVDQGGGGAFTEIGQAVAVAQPGDIVVVRAGTYDPFVLEKGLRIVADPGVGWSPAPAGKIQIKNVPAGQSALLRGFVLPATSFQELFLFDNDGHVHLENVTAAEGGAAIFDSRQVSIHASSIDGLGVVRSTVSCTASTFRSQSRDTRINPPGISCSEATVMLGDCTVVGADQSPLPPAGPGMRVEESTVWIGGRNGGIAAGVNASNQTPVSAIAALSGTVHIDPTVPLSASGGAPAISGGAVVQMSTVPTVDGHVQAQVLTATAQAPAGSTSYLFFGFPLAPPVPLPFGNFWIGPLHVVLDASVVPPSGEQTATVPLPPLSPGFSILLQTVVVENNALSLSNPAILTIDE